MIPRLVLVLVVSPLVSYGCATMIHGTTQVVHFESTPPGATARVETMTTTTPGQLTLSRAKGYDVEFTKPGYLPAHSHIGQETSGAIWGNIAFGGIIGLVVDDEDGAGYNLIPETVTDTLIVDPATPDTAAKNPPGPGAAGSP
jgi:hypothetical protein